MEVLDRDEVEARAAAHRERLLPYVAPHLERRRRGVKHPVHDFMFTYYSQRPAQLLAWHPGVGSRDGRCATSSTSDPGRWATSSTSDPGRCATSSTSDPGRCATSSTSDPGRCATSSTSDPGPRGKLVESLLRLLRATAARPANLGCFGMHEWAMVYRADETRHPQPLRLGAAATDHVVESHRIGCSHFDAYRFFTPAAAPLNALRPTAGDRPDFEQPGCLHGNMDLYKHAFRLSPLICSDLVADAFELAWDIRIMDMRAAPYDLSGVRLDPTGEPWTPIKVETPEGKREYADLQRRFAERAAPIRAALIAECERLLQPDSTREAP